MIWLTLVVAFGFLMIGFFLFLEKFIPKKDKHIYVKRQNLYTRQERKFLGHLVRAVGKDYLIMGKVRVADIITVDTDQPRKAQLKALEKICLGHVDFVLTDKLSTKIIGCVELYSPSNDPMTLAKRAKKLDQIFAQAELPLIRFQASEEYHASSIRKSIFAKISPHSAHTNRKRVPVKRAADPLVASSRQLAPISRGIQTAG